MASVCVLTAMLSGLCLLLLGDPVYAILTVYVSLESSLRSFAV